MKLTVIDSYHAATILYLKPGKDRHKYCTQIKLCIQMMVCAFFSAFPREYKIKKDLYHNHRVCHYNREVHDIDLSPFWQCS